MKIGKELISAQEIDEKLAEMGAAITRDYQGQDLLLVGILGFIAGFTNGATDHNATQRKNGYFCSATANINNHTTQRFGNR